MDAKAFQAISSSLPNKPGIYKYFDNDNELLYVGKAKNIRKRVSSYFTKTFTSYKTHELVNRIHRIEFTIVHSEQDAFLLENSLIKEFQPRFNINLKDDKSYPYIIIKKEPFPRIFLTRKRINDGSEYLGPFTSAGKVRELINFIRQYIPLRTCKLNLTQQNIERKKFKVCLEYHLGNCKGPCEGLQSQEDYTEGLMQVRQLLKGNMAPVISKYKIIMNEYSANLDFEKAEMIRKKIDHLEKYQARSVVVSRHLTNVDVFSIVKEADVAFVNYLMVQNGTIIQTHTVELQARLEETESDILVFAIAQLRENFNSTAAEIVVPFAIDYPGEDTIITVPKGGDKLKLVELSQTNVQYFRQELRRQKTLHLEQNNEAQHKVLLELQQSLGLKELPAHIECFDNSNFQGSYPVSAMVCFKNGLPSKKDYRHFNVKTVKGINDFATMKEVVFRRYRRLINEEQPLPQLVIIDGGKGQLSAAMESIHELNLEGKLTVVGLAKNEEEIFFPGDTESIKLSWNSEGLNLIRRIRDEVHRFGITFHRNKRSKGTFKNELENIEGIGEKTATLLLQQFKSVKKIKEASFDELQSAVGKSKAEIIKAYFN
ncbi:excinuclease ABC subunit UvrC [Parafilimonas terrae]|uniref:UvrABC system protein C n=1 Tax=Parafilimonas terrae TaxID=1465490 RepID=A0A1I5VKM6_9BACT|nr:excinuclease ABC subunit UvrC [Parafilimonas terrae]SFQ08023.1 Excinuclease ABC subunit C [Parafilimonas terrae]